MTRRTWSIAVIAVVVLGLVTLGSLSLAFAGSHEQDCPGKIICPLTGEKVCLDKCPLNSADRKDCPGKKICPLTGKLICKDLCPVEAKKELQAKKNQKPACCDRRKQ